MKINLGTFRLCIVISILSFIVTLFLTWAGVSTAYQTSKNTQKGKVLIYMKGHGLYRYNHIGYGWASIYCLDKKGYPLYVNYGDIPHHITAEWKKTYEEYTDVLVDEEFQACRREIISDRRFSVVTAISKSLGLSVFSAFCSCFLIASITSIIKWVLAGFKEGVK